MANVTITQLPIALSINGATDYVEISTYAAPPSPVSYISKRTTPKVLYSPSSFSATGTFTLAANSTTTTVPVIGCAPTSVMSCPCPLTASAAASMASTEYSMQANQFIVTHASNAKTDRTFMYVIFY